MLKLIYAPKKGHKREYPLKWDARIHEQKIIEKKRWFLTWKLIEWIAHRAKIHDTR